jgi:hypothetical protein
MKAEGWKHFPFVIFQSSLVIRPLKTMANEKYEMMNGK